MQFAVGQKIFGRSTKDRYCSYKELREVEEYIIDKVGKKYIYVRKEDWTSKASFPVCKETLWSKEGWREMEFFSSIQAMQEYDEEEFLFRELRMIFLSPNRVHKFGVEKLRAIKALFDDSCNLVLMSDVHSLILADEEKDTMDAILTMGLERVNSDGYSEVMVHGVIYKVLKHGMSK